jgi:hypothetical protein
MENEMDINRDFAKAILKSMEEEGIDLAELEQRAPRGFWELVIKTLNEMGTPGPKEKKWIDAKQASQHWKRNMDSITTFIDEVVSENTAPMKTSPEEQVPAEPNRNDAETGEDLVTRREFREALKDLEAMIENKISQVKAGMEVSKIQKAPDGYPELAPQPAMTGKKFTVGRQKLGVTIDSVLMEKLEKESKTRGISMSRMVDTVVWHYFGRPRLSFEEGAKASEEGEP